MSTCYCELVTDLDHLIYRIQQPEGLGFQLQQCSNHLMTDVIIGDTYKSADSYCSIHGDPLV
jgi:hypothetical protein